MVILPSCSCCGVCEACVDLSKVVSVPAYGDGQCHPTQAQDCTITIPDEYSLPVTVRISGYVDDDVLFNGSILEPDKYIYADDCNGAHVIGTADDGPGYVDKTVYARTFTLKLIDNFGAVSSMDIRVCVDPNDVQKVCIPPTSNCPPPPPPMVQCCQRIEECDTATVAKCVYVRADVCCKSYSYGTETDCEGSTPPYTPCEAGGASPSGFPPYDCINGAFSFGAWVTVSGWSAYTGDRSVLDADLVALYEEAESKVNQTFHVPMACLGSEGALIDLGAGESRDTRDCSGAHWFAAVTINLCARTASVAVYNLACFDSTDIQIDLGELTAITVPCNSWTGCNCQGYDDTIPINFFVGGGSVTVSSS